MRGVETSWFAATALGVVVALAVCIGGCKREEPKAGPVIHPTPIADPIERPTADTKVLAAANTRFGFRLFAELLKEEAGKNVFVSPSSVALALAMTYNGAAGETQQAMAKALEVTGLTAAQLNEQSAALCATLENPDPQVQLTIANSLWARKGVPFSRGYLDLTRRFFAAEVTDLDFGSPDAVRRINGWVSDRTKGKIREIVGPDIPEQMVLFVINAVYFKGRWTEVFEEDATQQEPFTLLDAQRKTVPLMAQSGHFRYLETEGFQAIRLPYGRARVGMYVFLPKEATGITEFCATLSAEQWAKWLPQLTRREGTIKLPRFRAECSFDLNAALKALGMAVAFDQQRADFGPMTGGAMQLWIDQVKHKTFVEVNEKGTEAAAATSIGMAGAAAPMPGPPPFEMIVDHPFLCAICDEQTGTVLFMGAIVAP